MSRLRKSLFLKILLVFLVAAIAHVAVLRYFQKNFLFDERNRLHRMTNMGEYGILLSRQLEYPIKTPEQMEKFRALAENLHLQIRLTGSEGEFVSSNDVPTLESIVAKSNRRPAVPDTLTSRVGDKLAIVVDRKDQGPEWHALFLLESENALDQHPQLIADLVAILSVVLLFCFLAVRALLAPLKEISQGVTDVAAGNLSVQLAPSKSGDELSQLADSFNSMLEKIRGMLSLREQLLLDISHEFRSPLTRIKVAMELIDVDEKSEARMSIERSLKDLDAMTGELLESARLETSSGGLRVEPTLIVPLVSELVAAHEDIAPGVQFRSNLAATFEIQADSARLQTALRNLVENAQKYSSESTRPVDVALQIISVGDDPAKQRAVQITVQDFGIGIPQEELGSIFEPFYRVDRSRRKSTGGYGLGLALTKKIVEAHGGRIEVESEPGNGSTFRVVIPLPN